MIFTTNLTKHLNAPDALGFANASSVIAFDVHNPSTGQLLASLPDMDLGTLRATIDVAAISQKEWAGRPAAARSDTMRRWCNLIVAHADDLAAVLTAEMGKPLPEARSEILHAAAYVEWYAEEAKRIYGETFPAPSSDKRMVVIKQPIGVVGAITPWNFPASMVARKVAPALAVGCSVVLKPAEQTPLVAFALHSLAQRAGFPLGVFNLILAAEGDAIGKELCANLKVRKISFTGSTEIGRLLMRQCSDHIKKVSLELGGNAPFIVFDDADLDAAIEGTMQAKFRNAGQTCVSANRIYIQDGIYDRFAEKLTEKVRRLSVGDGLHLE